MIATLHWLSANGEEQVFPLTQDLTRIGRQGDADIVLGNQNVSRRHAKIVHDAGGHTIFDLDSTHGTFVNSEPIKERRLRNGDVIEFGKDHIALYYFTDDGRIPNTDKTDTTKVFERSLNDLGKLLPSEYSELEKLKFFIEEHYQWEQSYTPDAAFVHILQSALKISGAERAYIMVRNLVREDQSFDYAAGLDGNGRRLSESEFKASRTVANEVVSTGRPMFMLEGLREGLDQQASIVAMNIRAVACVPLRGVPAQGESVEILGILYLDSKKTMHSLSGLDQRILERLADEAGAVLERIEMIKSAEQRRKLEQELALAEETQRSLLPQALPQVEGFRVRALSKPTRYVGGDFYDFVQSKSGAFTGVLADVSGKGVAASLLSSMTLGCLEMQLRAGLSIVDAIGRINRFLSERSSASRFVTMFGFTLNPNGEGTYVNAGHNPVYLFRASTREIEELSSNSMVVGAFSFATYESAPLKLGAGDVLVAYSDGLTEAENPAGEMLGESRVKAVISTEALQGAERLEHQLLETIRVFTKGREQTDDITIIIVQKI